MSYGNLRQLTGSKLLDTVLDGGLVVGQVIGLLGPTSGGKTLLTIDVAVQSANFFGRGPVHYYSCQEPVKEISRRMQLTAAAGWNGGLAENLPLYDFSGTVPGRQRPVWATLSRSLDQLGMDGKQPSLVVIDGLDALCRYGCEFDEFRFAVLKALDKLKQFARQRNVPVLVTYPLATDAARRSAVDHQGPYCGMECRGFLMSCDEGLVISPTDPVTNLRRLICVKSRTQSMDRQMWWKPGGNEHRVETQDGDYQFSSYVEAGLFPR